ncbi:MAG: hypothetical protein ACK5AZ_25470 [Bryobacteraceae bacterium]
MTAVKAFAALLAFSQQTPPPLPTFQADAHLAPIAVSVTERTTGRPIGGLTASDFIVFDEGRNAEIVAFDIDPGSLDLCLVVETSGTYGIRYATPQVVQRLVPGDRLGVARTGNHSANPQRHRRRHPALPRPNSPSHPPPASRPRDEAFEYELDAFMERMRTQYVLGIRGARTNSKEFRGISVRLTDAARARHPNAVLTHRNGYYTATRRR